MNTSNETIVVIGVGRIGLPFALVLADHNFNVIGVDMDPQKIATIQQKKLPFMEEGADKLLQKHYGVNFSVIHESFISAIIHDTNYIVITLGTPLNDTYGPDLTQIDHLFKKIIPLLNKGQTIILRSTLSPGTTELIARRLNEKGLIVGQDIYLAYCPERIAEGKSVQELYEIPQIVGVLDKESFFKAKRLFNNISPKIMKTDPRSAELSKLYSNMYRYIDFAIGNEFMMIAEEHDRDIYEILKLVNDGYKRSGLKAPGFTAGPCLVKDGFFLIDKGPYLELVTAAWRINENTPGFLFKRIKQLIPDLDGKRVAILGLSFKKNVDDTRYSLSLKLERHFLSEGADVHSHDPYISSEAMDEVLRKAEIVVVAINHDAFNLLTIDNLRKLVSKDAVICDIWNLFGTGKIIFKINDVANLSETLKYDKLKKTRHIRKAKTYKLKHR